MAYTRRCDQAEGQKTKEIGSNFEFLEARFPVLADLGAKAEQYLRTDANSCLMKLGMIGETVVALCFDYDHIPRPDDDTAVQRIKTLRRDGYVDQQTSDLLHDLRKNRNKAVHENFASEETAEVLIQVAYTLCEWFMQVYGDYDYEHRPFDMSFAAVPPVHRVPASDEEEVERRLRAEAEAEAKTAPAVAESERKERALRAASQRQLTENETRHLIDMQLREVGWEADTKVLRYQNGTRPQKGRNIAIAEWPTDSDQGTGGRADYALFVGTRLVAIVEAKAKHKDIPSVIDYQCKDYSRHIRSVDNKYVLGKWGEFRVPFTFATNGRPYLEQVETKSGIWFLDLRKPDNTPRALRGWIRPEDLLAEAETDLKKQNAALRNMSPDFLKDPAGLNLRDYQLAAVEAAENAILNGENRALIAMATGTGKTRTILGLIYRLLKADRFRRILFLVDRTALGEQAADVFKDVKLEELMTLDSIYNVTDLSSHGIEPETRVHIATVQSMVKRLQQPLDESEARPAVSDYDLIIVDEAHRGYILNKEMGEDELLYRDQKDYQGAFRMVLDYFDAVKIGLTATPALHTTQIFGEPVFSFGYREAVIKGYLSDHDAPHRLRTKLSSEGIHYKKGDVLPMLDPVTQTVTNSVVLEDEVSFDVDDFNKKVITREFNRAVLEEIALYIDPEEPGKTLIYAVNNSHADMIVDILKEIYGEMGVDNSAVMKITGTAGGGDKKKIQDAINRFKNERFPSVVVTVDLLTTGIDVPQITTLVFLRRVRSRILYEQMLGRATRLCPEIGKDHFEIFDPVGLYDVLKEVNTMKPVSVDPGATFVQLLDGLAVMEVEDRIQNQVDQIVAKLQRKRPHMTAETLEHFADLTEGKTPDEFVSEILQRNTQEAKNYLFVNEKVLAFLDQAKGDGRFPIAISTQKDELLSHVVSYGDGQKPEDYIQSFIDFVNTKRNEIDALNIVCARPKDLTRDGLVSLRLELDRAGFTAQQLSSAVSEMTNEAITADIISLIRRYALGTPLVPQKERIASAVERLEKAHHFTKLERNWIARIQKYLERESVLSIKTFDEDSRFQSQGGFNKINKAFGNKLEEIVNELNNYLYDDGGISA